MSQALDEITIKGFKSIESLEGFKLNALNIIVGANGSGKSNFISFFKLLNALISGQLNRFVRDSGSANNLLYAGPKHTKKVEFSTSFGDRGFRFNLVATPNNDAAIEDEARYYNAGSTGWWELGDSSNGTSKMVSEVQNKTADARYSRPIYEAISSWKIYHFHDTSASAPMRREEIIQDNRVLRWDAANIGAFLLKLKTQNQSEYQEIVNAIKLVTLFLMAFYCNHSRVARKKW